MFELALLGQVIKILVHTLITNTSLISTS